MQLLDAYQMDAHGLRLGKAGRMRWLGRRPVVRGIVSYKN
jgi:ribosomal protein L2